PTSERVQDDESALHGLLLFLTIGCSRISSHFPYTTLFRSSRGGRQYGRDRLGDAAGRDRRTARRQTRHRKQQHLRRAYRHRRGADRKSTRLNSSHVKISYAVFCLKKKNNKKRLRHITNH